MEPRPLPPRQLVLRQTWPRPLWLHLSAAWQCLSNSVTAWMSLPHGSTLWKTAPGNAARQLHANADKLAVAHSLAQQAGRDWQNFLRGLWLYQHHPAPPTPTAKWSVVACHGGAALKTLKPRARNHKTPVLLVPSLINGYQILDLHPTHSFAGFLCDQGYAVYLIDWHHDPTGDLPHNIAASVIDFLLPLLNTIPGPAPHVIGYCMGGTLSLAAACLQPDRVKSLTLIATPWDFHQPDRGTAQRFAAALESFAQAPLPTVRAEWLQILFWQRDPLAALRKFKKFAQTAQAGNEAALFVAAEDWLNSGVDLPTPFLHDCATRWFAQNATANGAWRIGDVTITPGAIDQIPLHIINATRDNLVPPASSDALRHKRATCGLFETGHIGLFAGHLSHTRVWPQVQHFLARHNP